MARLILIALMITYFIACIFYFISVEVDQIDEDDKSKENDTFLNAYFVQRKIMENGERFVILLYFALTTLSTVGYGDYSA
jgi:hypothetical protein